MTPSGTRASRLQRWVASMLLVLCAAPATAMGDEDRYWALVVDQLEHRWQEGADSLRWDLEGWFGGDTNRLWWRAEGDSRTQGGSGGEFELHVFYARHVSAYWDFLVGARQDVVFGPGRNRERTYAVLSLEGLAPYRAELEPSLFVADDGDVSLRLTATTDLYVTQRLIAQPRFEINVAADDAREFGVRSGVNDVELGLRLRYEIRREVAPYVGVSWLRRIGSTAELARARGEGKQDLAFVAGVRFWF